MRGKERGRGRGMVGRVVIADERGRGRPLLQWLRGLKSWEGEGGR
jgi:hypothetical protein